MNESGLSGIVETILPERFSRANADVVFDQQDSGCVSWGVSAGGRRWFVKQAMTTSARQSLENCQRFHHAVQHAAVVRPVRVLDTEDLTLVYPWVPGSVLNAATGAGSDRAGLAKLRSLDVDSVSSVVTTVFEAHRVIASHGFVAVDFYDGCLLYDFDDDAAKLIDLDNYRLGPFVLDLDRLPGSTSYMAPEEFERGALIDQRTTVFNLGRLVDHLLQGPGHWRGTARQAALVERATAASPTDRFQTVAELSDSWMISLAP